MIDGLAVTPRGRWGDGETGRRGDGDPSASSGGRRGDGEYSPGPEVPWSRSPPVPRRDGGDTPLQRLLMPRHWAGCCWRRRPSGKRADEWCNQSRWQ